MKSKPKPFTITPTIIISGIAIAISLAVIFSSGVVRPKGKPTLRSARLIEKGDPNGVWGVSNGLTLEGATADAFEASLEGSEPRDPTRDITVTRPRGWDRPAAGVSALEMTDERGVKWVAKWEE